MCTLRKYALPQTESRDSSLWISRPPCAISKQLVERLEHGDLPLEESLAAFERGVMLTRSCQTALKRREQKVEILLKKAGEPQVEDFDADEPKGG